MSVFYCMHVTRGEEAVPSGTFTFLGSIRWYLRLLRRSFKPVCECRDYAVWREGEGVDRALH